MVWPFAISKEGGRKCVLTGLSFLLQTKFLSEYGTEKTNFLDTLRKDNPVSMHFLPPPFDIANGQTIKDVHEKASNKGPFKLQVT